MNKSDGDIPNLIMTDDTDDESPPKGRLATCKKHINNENPTISVQPHRSDDDDPSDMVDASESDIETARKVHHIARKKTSVLTTFEIIAYTVKENHPTATNILENSNHLSLVRGENYVVKYL